MINRFSLLWMGGKLRGGLKLPFSTHPLQTLIEITNPTKYAILVIAINLLIA
jgi:hypothetical protein